MSAQDSSDYELLTEHFGYPPVSLLDDIINTVNVLADRALDSVERLLLSIPPQKLGFGARSGTKSRAAAAADEDGDQAAVAAAEAARSEIETGTHQLETLLNASIDKNFDLFELYTMRNILTVRPQDRPYMRLAHYDGLDLSLASSSSRVHQQQDRPTVESVTALRRRLQASQRLHAALEAERLRNDELLRQLHALLGVGDAAAVVKQEERSEAQGDEQQQEDAAAASPFGFLAQKGALTGSGGEQPITTTTEFALSQLQAIRALSTSLRTLLPDVGPDDSSLPPHRQQQQRQRESDAERNSADDDDDDDDEAPARKSWRRERAAYVETSSRKYLERVGGLELGPLGEVRDAAEWQGPGRRLSRGEVEGLERAAAAMVAAGAGRRANSEPPSGGRGGGGGGGGGARVAGAEDRGEDGAGGDEPEPMDES